jgi:hypothetical protein
VRGRYTQSHERLNISLSHAAVGWRRDLKRGDIVCVAVRYQQRCITAQCVVGWRQEEGGSYLLHPKSAAEIKMRVPQGERDGEEMEVELCRVCGLDTTTPCWRCLYDAYLLRILF